MPVDKTASHIIPVRIWRAGVCSITKSVMPTWNRLTFTSVDERSVKTCNMERVDINQRTGTQERNRRTSAESNQIHSLSYRRMVLFL